MEELLARVAPEALAVQKPGAGFSRERVEVESLIQVAGYRAKVDVRLMTNEGVRSRLKVPQAPGAFKAMLQEPDVAARSNADRRTRYLFAKAALLK